jgi:hypothetical protein
MTDLLVETSFVNFASAKSVVEGPSTLVREREGYALPGSQAGAAADSHQ